MPPTTANSGSSRPRNRSVAGRPVGPLAVGRDQPQADHRQVRDRERQHRAERVHVAQERRPGRGSASGRRSPPNTMIPIQGVRKRGCSWRRLVGHLAVEPHRVDEPRDADDPGVGGDEQDRRREQPDVDLGGVLQRPEVQALDDRRARGRRRTRPCPRSRPGASGSGFRRSAPAAPTARSPAARVDREHGDHHPVDRAPGSCATRVLGLLGHVRDRLDPGVGDHAHRDRDEEVLPGRAPRPGGRCGPASRARTPARRPTSTSSSWVQKSMTASTMFSAGRLLDADDVDRATAATITPMPDEDVARRGASSAGQNSPPM